MLGEKQREIFKARVNPRREETTKNKTEKTNLKTGRQKEVDDKKVLDFKTAAVERCLTRGSGTYQH